MPLGKVVSAVNRMTLREQTLENIRASILDGSISPGAKLAEVELSTQLGVSRGTVREALRTLEQMGLAVQGDRSGLTVRRLSENGVRELYEARLALEGDALELLMARPDFDECIKTLQKALPPEHVNKDTASLVAAIDRDLAFHEELMKLSQNRFLLQFWRELEDLMRITILSDLDAIEPAMLSLEHHLALFDALASGSMEVASATLKEHMQRSGDVWAKIASRR